MRRIESTSFSPEIKGLVLAIGGATAVALVIVALVDTSDVAESVSVAAIGVGILALSMGVVLVPRLVVELSGANLYLRFIPFRTYKIPASEFTSMRPVEINAGDFGGVGLRYRSGTTGLIMRSGPGIELEHDGRSLVFSTNDPERVLEATRKLK